MKGKTPKLPRHWKSPVSEIFLTSASPLGGRLRAPNLYLLDYKVTAVFNLSELIGHWGYLAVFITVLLGNLGIPIPEESVLIVAGILVWKGKLKFIYVLVTGVLGATVGDNLGYWLGRRYGGPGIERYGQRIFITSKRLSSMQTFINHYGAFAVFAARFLPGLRFMAGPLAGTLAMPFYKFCVFNVIGALAYVPMIVVLGYGVGYSFGHTLETMQKAIGEVEILLLLMVVIFTVIVLCVRVIRARAN